MLFRPTCCEVSFRKAVDAYVCISVSVPFELCSAFLRRSSITFCVSLLCKVCSFINYCSSYYSIYLRGRVDNFSLLDSFSPFFWLIEFHCAFSISYKILPYCVYYYCILVRM